MPILKIKKITLAGIIFFLTEVALFAQAVPKMTVQQYIEKYKEIAVAEMHRVGIPASITMAQGLLESGNGNSRLAVKGNNHFGIKCKNNWTGDTIHEDDDAPKECFRAYKTAEESYIDHSLFLKSNKRYAFLFEFDPRDYKAWAYGLKQAGYATNPRYPELLIGIIERNNLHELDQLTPEQLAALKQPKKAEVKVVEGGTGVYTIKKGEAFNFNKIPAVKVFPGETVESIAKQHDLSPRQIRRYNDLPKNAEVKPGSIVYLQAKKRSGSEPYHTVKAGENMYSISQLYGIRVKHLYKKNRMNKGTEPAPGEKLYMQSKREDRPKLYDEQDFGKGKVELPESIKKPDPKPQVDTFKKVEPKQPIDTIKKTEPKIEKPVEKIDSPKVESTPEPKQELKLDQKKVEEDKKTAEKMIEKTESEQSYPAEKENLDNVDYHEVKAGETLFSISKKYGLSVEDLKELNGLADYSIQLGQKLLVNKNVQSPETDVEVTNYYHEVKKGETLYSIAKMYNLSVEELKSLNNLSNETLSLGQKLLISKASTVAKKTEMSNSETYIVKKGDTLYSISRTFKVSVEELRKWNNLGDNGIKEGQTLIIKKSSN